MTNVAKRPEHARLVAKLKRALADHLRRTARRPEHVSQSDDIDAVIDFALVPRDVLPSPPQAERKNTMTRLDNRN